jgi:hypothetical protein
MTAGAVVMAMLNGRPGVRREGRMAAGAVSG